MSRSFFCTVCWNEMTFSGCCQNLLNGGQTMLVLNLRPKNPPPWAHQEAPDRVSDLVEVPPDALLPTDGDAKVIIS